VRNIEAGSCALASRVEKVIEAKQLMQVLSGG